MSFFIRVHPGADLLLVEAEGAAALDELCGVIDLIATISKRRKYTRAAANLLQLDSSSMRFTDHLELGAHAASQLSHLQRMASIVPSALRVGTSEKAAQKAGLQLRTFTELEPALDWLSRY